MFLADEPPLEFVPTGVVFTHVPVEGVYVYVPVFHPDDFKFTVDLDDVIVMVSGTSAPVTVVAFVPDAAENVIVALVIFSLSDASASIASLSNCTF